MSQCKDISSRCLDRGYEIYPPPQKEVIDHEEVIAREVEEMEVVDEDREERLERMKRKAVNGRQGRNMAAEIVEKAVIKSRMNLCRKIVEESLVDTCWEELETSRLINEVEGGGAE